MLKTFINDNSFIKQKKSKKYFEINRTLTPIRLICQNGSNIFNKKASTTYNLKKLNKNGNNNSITKESFNSNKEQEGNNSKNIKELESAKKIADYYKVNLDIIDISNLFIYSNSSMLNYLFLQVIIMESLKDFNLV